jgi:glyoxylase-like metal-dependent hydrolase (beta-lactamase superfamily II)
MTETNKKGPQGPHKISRRIFGQLLGMPVVLATTVTTATVAACGGGDDQAPDPDAATMSRAAFVATISDYFDWVHSSEYHDPYKAVQPNFVDVVLGATPLAKQIECALEEQIISNAQGNFFPDQPMTREDAADIYVKAFLISAATPDALAGFSDAASIGAARRASVAAMVAGGYMPARSAGQFAPTAAITAGEAKAILASITARRVAPPQVMCKPGTTAPRRYVRISTPTPGATIYYSYTFDGSEPADPLVARLSYDFVQNGVLQFVNPLTSTTDSRLYRLKTVAVKDGLASSPVRHFVWNIVRPNVGRFQARLQQAGSADVPTIWRIHNPAEYFQAFAFYIEGSTRGLLFDAGEYDYLKENLKAFVDTLATKPYDVIVGHNHPDHAEQVYNFTSAGVTLYMSAIEKAALTANGRTADHKAAGAAAVALQDGQVLDLGNVQLSAFQQPGHTNGLVTVIIHQTGQVYCSDMFACNRAYTADTTQYNGVKVDLFLSLLQQLLDHYRSRSTTGLITQVTNAHQEVPVGMAGVNNFVKCFQQLIDRGDAATEPSIRGGVVGNPTAPTTRNSRMSKVGDMWRDKNWMAIGNALGSGLDRPVDYFSAPTAAYPSGVTVDYNAADGFKKYSELSNIRFGGGTLVGVDVYWAAPSNGVANKLANKFDPWTKAYTVNVPAGTTSLVVTPTAMSNGVSAMRVNGSAVAQGASTSVAVAAGTVIAVEVVSPDGSAISRYSFSVAVV